MPVSPPSLTADALRLAAPSSAPPFPPASSITLTDTNTFGYIGMAVLTARTMSTTTTCPGLGGFSLGFSAQIEALTGDRAKADGARVAVPWVPEPVEMAPCCTAVARPPARPMMS